MKNNFLSIKKWFARARDRDPAKATIHPERDWMLLIALFLIGIVLAVTVNYYLFVGYVALEPAVVVVQNAGAATSTQSLIDLQALRETLDTYLARRERLNLLVREPMTITDPAR